MDSQNNDSQTVLVLGGGAGGLVSAGRLRKKLPASHRVVLVDRSERYVYDPSLLWLMTGSRTPENITRSRRRLERKGIEVVLGEIEHIDPAKHFVRVDGNEVEGDHIIISLGAELVPELVSGLAEAGHNFYTLEGAESLRDAVRNLRSGRLVVLTASSVYKCPAAPYEAALLLEADCRRRGVGGHVQIDVYAAEQGPMGVAGPEVSAGVKEMLRSQEIGYHPEHQVGAVDPEAGMIAFVDGTEVGFDLLAYVPPHRAPQVVHEAGLVGESGWVTVDPHTLETGFPGVYAIGDITSIPLAMGKPLPKAGVFAHGQAEVVVDNIVHSISGKGRPARFDGHGACFIETGDGRAGFGRGDFYAKPVPEVKLYRPGRHWHVGKVLFEKDWLFRRF